MGSCLLKPVSGEFGFELKLSNQLSPPGVAERMVFLLSTLRDVSVESARDFLRRRKARKAGMQKHMWATSVSIADHRITRCSERTQVSGVLDVCREV